MTASGPNDVVHWLLDRRDNCLRFAGRATPADRQGWLLDAAYFNAAAQLILDSIPSHTPTH